MMIKKEDLEKIKNIFLSKGIVLTSNELQEVTTSILNLVKHLTLTK